MENIQNLCRVINQIHDMERKAQKQDITAFDRQFKRIKEELQEMQVVVENPMGQAYDDRRTDYEASIVGDKVDGLAIVDVLKPIVYLKDQGAGQLVQRGVVIVEGK